jgi:hypothetical protein
MGDRARKHAAAGALLGAIVPSVQSTQKIASYDERLYPITPLSTSTRLQQAVFAEIGHQQQKQTGQNCTQWKFNAAL